MPIALTTKAARGIAMPMMPPVLKPDFADELAVADGEEVVVESGVLVGVELALVVDLVWVAVLAVEDEVLLLEMPCAQVPLAP